MEALCKEVLEPDSFSYIIPTKYTFHVYTYVGMQ